MLALNASFLRNSHCTENCYTSPIHIAKIAASRHGAGTGFTLVVQGAFKFEQELICVTVLLRIVSATELVAIVFSMN